MWLTSIFVLVLWAESAQALPEPGKLRVPKVYNAVITSNQNLASSRAYPVIQPVVHKTAIGYVPPAFYYTQIAPGGYGIRSPLPLIPGRVGPPQRPDDVDTVEGNDGASSSNTQNKRISRPSSTKENDESSEISDEQTSSTANGERDKKTKNDRVPLSFYPNYQSLYYDPYFYPYNAFPPNFAPPGTYYVGYPQPPPGLLPLPPPGVPIQPVYPEQPGRPAEDDPPEESEPREPTSSRHRNEKEKLRSPEKRDKIPDVPPPPLPTTLRKNNS